MAKAAGTRGPRRAESGWAAALALGLALALALGAADDAAAQNACRGDDPTNKAARISCQEGSSSSANIVVDASNLNIAETGTDDAITAFNEGSGSVSVTVTASTLSMTGDAWVIYGSADNNDMDLTVTQSTLTTSGWVDSAVFGFAEGSGTVSIDLDRVTLTASGRTNNAIYANNRGSGAIDIDITGGTITASASGHDETLRGIRATHQGTGGIDINIDGGAVIETTGRRRAAAIWARIQNTRPANAGTIRIRMTGGSLSTTGTRAGTGPGSETGYSYGVGALHENAGGLIDIGLDGVTVTTTGDYSSAVHGEHIHSGGGAINIALTDSTLSTAGTVAHGVIALTRRGAVDIDVTRGSITTAGTTAHGVYARNTGSAGAVDVTLDGAVVTTRGTGAHGVFAGSAGTAGAVDVTLDGAVVTTSGTGTHGVWGSIAHGSNTAALTVGVTGGAVTAEGVGAVGVLAHHAGLGSIALTVGAGAEIRAPVGARGRLLRDANAAGRLVVTHEGTIEARDAGIVAWAARRSGHTQGAGEQDADDAARTEPMIHVTSSGDVTVDDITVGEGVTDAFIRAAIAGEDEALSAAEKAVFDAIVADDSGALDTALAALPASYDAAWKARARALSDSRSYEPDAGVLANRAAEEIMGLTRSGIRALALSHEAIVGHVRHGDGDGALSAAERTVLAAALTGGDLETALTALSATYTNTWKDGVRQRALAYNAGDIQVDVTGGTITAEGDGVDARYTLTHDQNGAIAVAVAAGATVSGGRHGVHVGGAGLVTGNADLRDQTVTVNGAVMGGTGAGVHLAGGGTVTVGKTGRVGATSGDGILSEGAGDLVATVHGTVAGDIRAMGGGALTVDVQEGGVVTGTVHDPVGPVTVRGSVGRLLYSNGGAVTVAATGRITGVEGETDGIRSDAGALSVTVAGTVAGDVRALGGGALTLAVMEGGSVTGTVHDPVGPLTVAGSVGRLLYSNGGTVTVSGTGRITGVEGETDGIRSEAGALSVTVAGTVAGDVRALGGGALTLAVMEGGSVTGTVHDPVGPLTVAGSVGRLLYSNGGTVTVSGTGRITGVEGETDGIRSEAGDLSVTVAGAVDGDIRALGGGDLDATISGRVDGDLLAQGGTLRLNLMEGSAITGTVHDPVGPLTLRASSIGRLLYTTGGTVTVASTGRLTGVDGETAAIQSEAGDLAVSVAGTVQGDIRAMGGGDLDATISGRVAGDLLAQGGTLRLNLMEGSTVTGTVHDPVGPLTLRASSIGRLLYTSGGTVTVAGTGRLTGVVVEGGSEAIRSEAGDLTLSVAAMGSVTGDVIAEGDGDLSAMVAGTLTGDLVEEGAGDLDATISGRVEGDVFGRGTGEHTVTVSKSGTVTGTVHLAGSTVTVGGTVGRVTLENRGMVTVAQTGRVTGVPGGHGVEVGAGSTVTNRGTIAGKVGIRAGAGSTVVNYGTIRSTDGAEGIAVAFQPGQNTLTLHPGMTIIGKIQGLTGDDTVDLSNLEVSEVGLLTFVDETNTPRTPARIMRPRGVGRVINVGGALVGLDTTAFALTDDMLSDLTGSIHAAVVGTGRSAQPRAGTSAPGYVWATPFGGARNQDGTDTLGAGTHSFGGGLFGAGWGGDALHLGGFLGGSTGRLDVDNSQDVDVQTVFGGVYAQQARGAMRLDARLVLGHMEHDSTRRVGRSTATAEYTAIFFSPEAGLATRLPLTSTLHATPRLRVRYAGLFTEGFRERGTNWDLRVAERAVQILEVRGAVGVPIAVAGGGRLEPRVGLEGRWLLAGEKVEVSLPGGAFRVAAGGDTGVATGTVGFGLTLPVAAATTLVGNFDGALTTEEAWRATGYLGLTYSF